MMMMMIMIMMDGWMLKGHRKQLKCLPAAKADKEIEQENKVVLDYKPRYKRNNTWVHILVKGKERKGKERKEKRKEKKRKEK